MYQRACRRRQAPDRRRPPWTLLVESDEPGVDISDFDAFRCAGFEVELCAGPVTDARECPAVRGEPCDLLADADVVLFDIGDAQPARSALLAAVRARRPDVPIVVRSARPPNEAVPGCTALPTTTSVNGQVSALHRAVLRCPAPR
jgi:hypothetical protein